MIRIEIETHNAEAAREQMFALLCSPGYSAVTAEAAQRALNERMSERRAVVDAAAGPEPESPASPPGETLPLKTETGETVAVLDTSNLPAAPAKRGRPKKNKDVPAQQPNAPEPADGAGVSVSEGPSSPAGIANESAGQPQENSVVATSAQPAAAEPTHAVARLALQAYSKANGYEKAEVLIAGFGAEKITDLKPEQLADFIKACA